MEHNIFSITILLVVAVVILYGAYTFMKTRSEEILTRWARKNSYRILDCQAKVFDRGPFPWASKNQAIFRVAVEDAEGTQRTGWVRCGSYLGGLLSDEAEIKWDQS